MALGGELVLRPTTAGDLRFVLEAEWDDANRPFLLPWPRERHLDALCDPDVAHRILERTKEDETYESLIVMSLLDSKYHGRHQMVPP